jgi:hypothetical protein
MSAIERIKERLQRYPQFVYRVSAGKIVVEPPTPDGFTVSLTEGVGEWLVEFDGWHEHFTSEEEAVNCFAFGLSDQCRLRVSYRGSFPYRWTVEERTGNGWREESTTGLLFFPFWRRRRTVYRQNAIIRIGEPGAEADGGGK